MADKTHGIISHSLRLAGFDVEKSQDAFFLNGILQTPREPGRFDLQVRYRRTFSWVEVKNDELSFKFDAIDADKRSWSAHKESLGQLTWLCLTLGTHRPDSYEEHHKRAWLLSMAVFRQVEALVKPIQNSLPFIAGKGYRKELQENSYDAVTMLQNFALVWHDGRWVIPPKHGFWAAMNAIGDSV